MIPIDIVKKLVDDIHNKRYEKLEMFALGFIAETGLHPSECELVEENQGNKIIWYFRARNNEVSKTMSGANYASL